MPTRSIAGVQFFAPAAYVASRNDAVHSAAETILTTDAVRFVADLARRYTPRVTQLLEARNDRQREIDAGAKFDFLKDTAHIRDGKWHIAHVPDDLQDRRVEITGPVDRKMIINALNSGANVFMADFEDSTCPTWDNTITGQLNLFDAVRRKIHLVAENGKEYSLNDNVATLMVRPRGWHLVDKHMVVDGEPVPAGLFDFGFYFFHNAAELKKRGAGPYFYLPKMESHLEARLWNDVFVHAQEKLSLPKGTIKATVLIETLPAAFEMDEILYELREHSAGLNCGRWDYIFSFIKKFQNSSRAVLPDRGQITMDKAFLHAYTQLLIKTCHRRNAHAMGGMAAQIPIKNDPLANDLALERVRADKLREVKEGCDGTWVAHPALVAIARKIFDEHMPSKNQINQKHDDVHVTAEQLVKPTVGTQSEDGLRHNISVGIQYLQAWLGGSGCVPLYHLMEDAATAEISRAQVWQWIRHRATLDSGRLVTRELVGSILNHELARLSSLNSEHLADAGELFRRLCISDSFEQFLTLPAYEKIIADEKLQPL